MPAAAEFHNLPAPAKVNLFLHIVGRRGDGYHLLQSVFVLIDWCDTLNFDLRTDGQLRRHDLGPALPADDLCLKAARALQQASGCPLGADIAIDKKVPWGAGLGGGSSDAATTLLALNRLWQLNWSRQRLLALGLTLGADVPFFIAGQPAWVEGIGERITPVAVAPMQLAVVKPPASLPTAQIFAHPRLKRDTEAVIVEGSFVGTQWLHGVANCIGQLGQAGQGRHGNEDAAAGVHFGRNDLQPVAELLCPEVAEVGAWLNRHHGNSRMTGSGSAVFAKVSTADSPLATWPPAPLPAGWVGRLCWTLPEHPLRGWAQ